MSNEHHLKKGDPEPKFTDKTNLQLFSMKFCPFSQRVRLVLDAKHIPYDITNINLMEKPEWLTKYNPYGKVPVLGLTNEKDHPWIYEAVLIADYLDEKYPDVPLYPSDPLEKIQERLWIHRFGIVPIAFQEVITDGLEKASEALRDIQETLEDYEEELYKRNTPFFGGDTPGMLDYMMWPFCERFGVLKHYIGVKYELDSDRYATMIDWAKNMLKDEAVKISYLPTDVHIKYADGRIKGSPDYDLPLTDEK